MRECSSFVLAFFEYDFLPMSTLKELMKTLPQQGQVEWLGIRAQRRAPLISLESIIVSSVDGIDGDHYKARSQKRQVTLIQAEHLKAIAGFLGRESVKPESLRRNIVVSGINLLALKEKQIAIGEVVLEMTGLCHPCSRMEEEFGPGGYNAVRGHGGITAQVHRDGVIRLGDSIRIIEDY